MSSSRRFPGGAVSVEFLGSGGDRLFGCTYLPTERLRAAALVLSPLHAEARKNYRAETWLCESLCRRGVAVTRFHYRGAGHSDGDTRSISLDSMRVDAEIAADHLTARAGMSPSVVVGTRLGAFAAAHVVQRHDAALLVLWEPILDGGLAFRDAWRAARMADVVDTDGGPARTEGAPESLTDLLARDGFVDLLGYPLTRELYDSLRGQRLASTLGGRPPSVLLVQMGGRRIRTDVARQADVWRATGCSVDVELSTEEIAWWLSGDPAAGDDALGGVRSHVRSTADWLERHLEGQPV